MGPTRTPLPGGRWHFAHGPIELVIGADEAGLGLRQAHEAAWARFQAIEDEVWTLIQEEARRGPAELAPQDARRA